ncbi:hypothetical protein C5S35_11935 [Candidatus Methanophagaceae archaeon]|nr:hypothetical protein C5S35_11935 [Methanophagales archaeon]
MKLKTKSLALVVLLSCLVVSVSFVATTKAAEKYDLYLPAVTTDDTIDLSAPVLLWGGGYYCPSMHHQPSGDEAAAAAAIACVLVSIWGAILNGLANVGISPISSSGGGGTAGGTSISPLIDPDTGEQLTVHDGTYEGGKTGQVWYDGQWLDRGTAAQWIAERCDELTQRQHERESFWSDVDRDKEQRIRDRADHLRDEGYVYDPAQDTWVPGQDHPSVIEQQRLQEAQQLNGFIERNVDDLARTDFLHDLVDRVRVNGGDMNRLRNAIMDNTVRAEHQAALAEAAELQGYEDTAAGIRDWSQRANRVIGWATGVGPVINAWQNAAYGTVQGYEQGGWHGAFTSAAAQLVDELVENYTHVPGTGTAFRDAYGTGYEKDKDGNWTSPMDRFASSLLHGVTDQYDPTKYIDRWQEADGLGDYFDIGMDAVEAIGDIRDAGRRVQDAYDRGIQIGDTDGKDIGRLEPDISAGPMTEKTQRMADNITIGADGKPHARLDDVLEIQRSTQDTRSLKSDDVNPHVPEGFNNTLRGEVYTPVDDAVKEHIKTLPGMADREIIPHEIRTPGKNLGADPDPREINTDRDISYLYVDDDGNQLEVKKELWQNTYYAKFAERTGYDSDTARDMLPTSEREAWDNMTDAGKKARWAEMHSQATTDKFHEEASRDFSKQGIDEFGKRFQKERANIVDVKAGRSTLEDARGLGDMYKGKVDSPLGQGNKPEAIAHMKKGVESLEGVRTGYKNQGYDVGTLPKNMQRGMEIIEKAHVDQRATPEHIAGVEQQLRDVGFKGGLEDFNCKLSAQIEAIKFAEWKPSRSSISTRIHWQDLKENESSFAEMAKDFMRRRNK